MLWDILRWEKLNNSIFNLTEFDQIRNESGSNAFVMTATKWVAISMNIQRALEMDRSLFQFDFAKPLHQEAS